MKRLFVLFFLVVGVLHASAQDIDSAVSEQSATSVKSSCDRKPVTSKWSLVSGGARYANHYLNSQEYAGKVQGIEAIHGRFYRRSENLSWRLTMSHVRNMHRKMFGGGLYNPANTSYISIQNYEADYAVFYNWLVKERLQLRVGGSFNVFGGFAIGDDNAINNLLSVDIQTQFYAKAQIRYGWDFKKFGLDLYANLATPFMGMMVVDERYENAVDAVGKSDFSLKEYGHCKFSSMHNLQGMNFEMGIDFALRNLALSLSYEAKNRWWHAYELQNYRRFSLIKLGLSVNLFAQPNRKVSNRQF
jgi:hypothetical protein